MKMGHSFKISNKSPNSNKKGDANMKIAVTADLHLKSREECPERWNALANIIDQMLTEGIKRLIIAGICLI